VSLTKFDQLKADIQVYIAPIKNLVVNSIDSQKTAMDVARELKYRATAIEDLRKALKAPYFEAGKQIDEYAKSLNMLLAAPTAEVSRKLLDWNRELEAVRQKEADRIKKEEMLRQAEADKKAKEAMELVAFEKEISGDEAGATAELIVIAEYERNEAKAKEDLSAALADVKNIRVKGVTLRWSFSIVNADAIPRKFMIPNEVLIRKAIVESDGALHIPGVEAFQTESLTIK